MHFFLGSHRAQLGWILLLGLIIGCGDDEPPRKTTYPVTGTVFVDGQPAANLSVKLYSVNGMDEDDPTFSTAFTDPSGAFSLSTYESGDGVPEGEYVLTFVWGEINPLSLEYGGPDRLQGRYRDPSRSQHRVTVQAGQPTDLGKIELTSR